MPDAAARPGRGRRSGRRGGGASTASDRVVLDGLHPVREALRARRRPLHRLRVAPGHADAEALRALAATAGVPVVEDPRLAAPREPDGRANPQGVALEAGPLPEVPLADLGDPQAGLRTLVALDGVEDPQNVGALARVADAAGVAGLVLTRRHAPPLGPAVSRASAGAIEWLPVARVANLVRALESLQARGFWTFGAEAGAPDDLFGLPDRLLAGSRVVVLGAEGRGIRPGVRQALDHRISIPMSGAVASLNVSTAAAVVLFELRRRAVAAAS